MNPFIDNTFKNITLRWSLPFTTLFVSTNIFATLSLLKKLQSCDPSADGCSQLGTRQRQSYSVAKYPYPLLVSHQLFFM
jgi:hypothetical protein